MACVLLDQIAGRSCGAAASSLLPKDDGVSELLPEDCMSDSDLLSDLFTNEAKSMIADGQFPASANPARLAHARGLIHALADGNMAISDACTTGRAMVAARGVCLHVSSTRMMVR